MFSQGYQGGNQVPPQNNFNRPPQQTTIPQQYPPQYTQSNPHQYPQFNQTQLLSPQNHQSRPVYASMIQPQSATNSSTKSSTFAGFGKLESMGRLIQEEPDSIVRVQEAPPSLQQKTPNTLAFRNPVNDKPKMSSSVIFPKTEDQLANFPTFNVEGMGTSRLDGLLNRGKKAEESQEVVQSGQDRKKREIQSIKDELNKLSKRMENVTVKKAEGMGEEGETKPYFHIPSRKSTLSNTNSTSVPQAPTSLTQNEATMGVFRNYSNSTTNQSSKQMPEYLKQERSNSNTLTYPQQPNSHYSQPQAGRSGQTYTQQSDIQQSSTSEAIETKILPKQPEAPTGMFKKKNLFTGDQGVGPVQSPKALLLSPKASLNTLKPGQFPTAEYKPAQIVDVPPPTKTMRRTDSLSIASTVTSVEAVTGHQELHEFKKSDFAIGKKMGKGQFGEVMLVQHKLTGFLCGMKVMSKKQIREEKYENQVARELSIQFFLSHRNVAPLYGYFTDEENVYLLVEFCTGGQLLQLLRKAHRMEEADCSPIIRQICEGLDYVHKEQIIHRDIKPENILFNFNTVKICDFGWAVYSGNGMRRTVAGSPLYYSPEVVLENKYDEKIDIWAIGMMTYECLLGKIPFRIYSELDLNRIVEDEIKFPEYIDVSDEAKDFILRICKKNPDDRMEMRDIMRHPFITKYLKDRKVPPEVVQQFRKVLN